MFFSIVVVSFRMLICFQVLEPLVNNLDVIVKFFTDEASDSNGNESAQDVMNGNFVSFHKLYLVHVFTKFGFSGYKCICSGEKSSSAPLHLPSLGSEPHTRMHFSFGRSPRSG